MLLQSLSAPRRCSKPNDLFSQTSLTRKIFLFLGYTGWRTANGDISFYIFIALLVKSKVSIWKNNWCNQSPNIQEADDKGGNRFQIYTDH